MQITRKLFFFFVKIQISINKNFEYNIDCDTYKKIEIRYIPHYRHNTAHEGFLALGYCTPSTRAILRRHVVWPATITTGTFINLLTLLLYYNCIVYCIVVKDT